MLKRAFALLVIMIVAAGCYQQAGDDFETIDSQNVQPTDNSDVIIIDPNSEGDGDTTPDDEIIISDMELTATAIFSEPTSTVEMIDSVVPTTPAPNPTATVRIIEPANANSTPTQIGDEAGDSDSLIATATRITVVTPGIDTQIDFPTATEGAEGDTGSVNTSGLEATPTAIAEVGDASCTYVIQSGDTLFRIAFNDDRFSLAELLSANDLAENAIIQPGQELVLPNCVPTNGGAVDQPPQTQPDDEPSVNVPAGSTVHVVTSGDTLFVIAQQYGVTIEEIVAANGLANPDDLSIGQELVIPQ